MSVYVDQSQYKYGRMVMCHMVADSIDELHLMADKIGIKRKWFQDHKTLPHYDICMAKRKLAIQFGAKEISNADLKKLIKIRRERKYHGSTKSAV